jgi:WD40 repeat protein
VDVVRVWSARDGRTETVCRGHTGSLQAVACGPGGVLASGARDGTWRLWGADGHETARGGGHGDAVLGVAFHPTDGRLATCGEGGVRLWDAACRPLLALGGDARLGAVTFSPDGKRLAAAGRDGARVWDADSGDVLLRLPGEISRPSLSFSPDGRRLALGAWRGARVWDAWSGRLLLTLPVDGFVLQVAFSPDGRRLADDDDHNILTLWDAPP